MNVVTTKTNLVGALSIARKAVPSSTASKSQPILANVLLQVQGKRLRFSGTDMALYVTTWFDGEIAEVGGVALPAETLGRLLPDLPEEKVHLQVNPRSLATTLRCGDLSTTLRGLNPADYIVVPELPKEGIDVDPLALKTAIGRVLVGAAKDTAAKRPSFTGALFTLADGKLTLVCTDGVRLAYDTIEILPSSRTDVPASFLLSARPLRELQRVITEDAGRKVVISFDGKLIALRYAHVELISQVIADPFPEDAKSRVDAVAAKTVTTLRLDREELGKATRRAASVLDENARHIRFEIDPAGLPGKLRVVGQSKGVGEVTDLVSAEVSGQPLEVNIAPSMLQEGAATFNSAQVELRFAGPLRPIMLLADEKHPHRFFFAPVKVGEDG